MRQLTEADVRLAERFIRWTFRGARRSDISDLVQDGLVGLCEAAMEFDPERAGWARLWRWRATERARRAHRRRAAAYYRESFQEGWFDPAGAQAQPEEDGDQWLLGFVTGPQRRRVAQLAWVQGKGLEQIARQLGVTYGTITAHLHDARLQIAHGLVSGGDCGRLLRRLPELAAALGDAGSATQACASRGLAHTPRQRAAAPS